MGSFTNTLLQFAEEYANERILKIGQYL